jgi:glutamate dehydrogenase (NADP+)
MLELWKYIGPEIDVPAGDIGVGGREIGFLYGMYKRLKGDHTGVLTGKGSNWGGSLIRPEATGFGAIYFVQEMLATKKEDLKGKTVSLSGFGNVAWGAALKAAELGAKIVTISGPDGYIYDPEGISGKKIDYLLELRASNQDIVKPFSYVFEGTQFHEGKRPWEVRADIALPCATQNELNDEDALTLMNNKVMMVAEVSNMGCTPEAVEIFNNNDIMFAPGKAVNAGGVATSGLEMTQNSMKMRWNSGEVDDRLHEIMCNIHEQCIKYGKKDNGHVDYVKGANIAGFLKVANSMLDMGII